MKRAIVTFQTEKLTFQLRMGVNILKSLHFKVFEIINVWKHYLLKVSEIRDTFENCTFVIWTPWVPVSSKLLFLKEMDYA